MSRFASIIYIHFVVCGAIPWSADKDFQINIPGSNMLGKHMSTCLLFSQTVGYFMAKNLSLKTYSSQLWILPALSIHPSSRAIPIDHSFFQNTQATRRMSSYLAGFLYTYTICVVMEIHYLSGLIPTYRFAFVFLTQEHALWFIMIHLQQ